MNMGARWRRLLHGLDSLANAHALMAVPSEHSVSGTRVALVCIGIAFTLTGLYTGAELGAQLGLRVGIHAVVLGGIVLTLMSIPAALVGARTRLSTYMIVAHVFGRHGAQAINLVLATVLLGWYAVTADLFGRTVLLSLSGTPALHAPQWAYTTLGSMVVIATTVCGFRAIDRLSLLTAPLLVALTAYVGWRALQVVPWNALLAVGGSAVDLRRGIAAVIGSMIVNVVLMPDLTRYTRSALDCSLISLAGNGIGQGTCTILAMLPALAFREIDPMRYIAVLGLAAIAFAVLVLSTWTMNAVNLYSTGLVTSTALRRVPYGRLVVGCGVLGTLMAVTGVGNRLIDFLVLLGLVVPPICAVYLSDYFVLRRRDYSHPGEGAAAQTNLNALLACMLGALVGLVMYFSHTSLSGIPTLEAFTTAGVGYWAGESLRLQLGRNRMWRR